MNINAFESKQVAFEFNLPMDVVIENLHQRVGDPKNSAGLGEGMVGSVSQNDTYIYRGVPGTRNSFRPTFYGSFTGSGSQTVLKGTISLNRVIIKFMYMWLAIVGLVGVATLVTVLSNPNASWLSLLHIFVMAALVYTMVLVLKNKCQPDIAWLEEKITSAVDKGGVS